MWQTRNPQEDIDEAIMTAIRICGSEGASLNEVQQYLIATMQDNVPDFESIQSSLNNGVAKGVLLELDNGKYRAKDSAERAEVTAEYTNIDHKVLSKVHPEDNETNATARRGKEKFQETERSIDKVPEDGNQNADSDKRNVGSSVTKEDANVSLPDDYDKVLTKLHRLYHKDNDFKATGKPAVENAQEVQRSVDKLVQDANRNADSDAGNVSATATEKDTNIPLQDDIDKIDVTKLVKKDK